MKIESEDYNYTERKKCQRWLNALFKINMKLERVIYNLPNLSDTDREEAMVELDLIMRRASRLEYQFSNELRDENR